VPQIEKRRRVGNLQAAKHVAVGACGSWTCYQQACRNVPFAPSFTVHVSCVVSNVLLAMQDALLKRYGRVKVTLSSANSISHDKIHKPLEAYVREMGSTASNSKGNETYYLFGPAAEISPRLREVVAKYTRPIFASKNAAYSFGIGAAGSGVPFHVHGQGFSEVIHGAKRWFLYPPSHRPPFDPDQSVLAWLTDAFPKYNGEDVELLQQCDIGPSDILYFPSMWWHAVINLSETVFMSSFEDDFSQRHQHQLKGGY
jgi:hypothetical protein